MSEDLTARARIRDAAIKLFSERGIDGASIRDIAAEAGVSSGLLRHHFGSKEALRQACDEYARDRMFALGRELVDEVGLENISLASIQPVSFPLQTYMARSMMDGSETAVALFLQTVEYGAEWAKTHGVVTDDYRAWSAVIAVMKLGVFVLRDLLELALGEDIASPTGYARMTRAFVDIFSQPLLTPEQADNLRKD
ncbi:TetR family transcriptional regulator [Kribbella sandramycini]|uniref:AcrR family transcriptional regulator n=1 Tax=Kribbella sandramycini TaxID=60450 RepID=A0A7Y4P493_9ACTN|nr:TetR family transcriptional regulator [Kribbella sandramycini]MBB6567168.1 AcrR family transcriptional regulator [Kribbella sandramycini]NOL44885.1 TetR family transcriptional regulator [Kribbella sandramycini]